MSEGNQVIGIENLLVMVVKGMDVTLRQSRRPDLPFLDTVTAFLCHHLALKRILMPLKSHEFELNMSG